MELLVRLNLNLILLVIFNESERMFYFLADVAKSKGTIITNVIKTEGLKSQYKRPIEKTRSQNSFFLKICIDFY